MTKQVGFCVPDFAPSMEAQSKSLRETAIAVTEREIEYHKARVARLERDLKQFKAGDSR